MKREGSSQSLTSGGVVEPGLDRGKGGLLAPQLGGGDPEGGAVQPRERSADDAVALDRAGEGLTDRVVRNLATTAGVDQAGPPELGTTSR